MTATSSQLVQDARSHIDNLSIEEFDRERAHALVIDLREAEEWNSYGMIPGAIAITRGMLEFAADPATPYYKPELQPESRILLYCQGGARSALAGKTLKEMGYKDIAHLEGGFKRWKEAGKPIR